MEQRLDPKKFGLPARSIIEKLDHNCFALIMERKSRIIMADGEKILQKIEKIKLAKPGAKVLLKTTAPVCSKTALFLEGHGIAILPVSQP